MHILRFDGLCGPVNPGGITIGGFLIFSPTGELLLSGGEVICRETVESTNNTAEWAGLVLGLRKLSELKINSIKIVGDSKVVIDSLKSQKVSGSVHLRKWKKEALKILADYDWDCEHVLRAFNAEADELGNQLYEAELKERPFDYSKLGKDHWVNQAATEKQLNYLRALGQSNVDGLSKGEASNLISRHKKN